MAMYLSDVCTVPSNLAGHPAISVPFGADDDGLPIGVQVLAPALCEPLIFRVAAVLEAAAPAGGGAGAGRRHLGRAPMTPGPVVGGGRRWLGAGHRPRGPLRAADRDQALLRLPQRLRRRAQHQRLPRLSRAARVRCRC